VLTIVLVDRWLAAGERTLPQTALADESAHLLTAFLILATVPVSLPARLVGGMLAGAVLIDLDHLPLILGSDLLTHETNRPLSHCLLSIAVAVVLATLLPQAWRWLLLGLAAGFAAHFWRDLATSTAGVPLLWPMQTTGFRLPYVIYLVSLIGCVAMPTLRREVRQ
jgi:membrane-bound metal-dependent hydrolase YbcI (DUF457 family)